MVTGHKTRYTLSLSDFKISAFNSFTRASLIAARVTLRRASSIRYRKASTCFLSKSYSLSLLPRAPCSASICLNIFSSRFAVGHESILFLPQSALGTTNEIANPDRPALAVLPTRCVYARDDVGRSKLMTHATSTKSTPRETPNSLSVALGPFLPFRELLEGFATLLSPLSPSSCCDGDGLGTTLARFGVGGGDVVMRDCFLFFPAVCSPDSPAKLRPAAVLSSSRPTVFTRCMRVRYHGAQSLIYIPASSVSSGVLFSLSSSFSSASSSSISSWPALSSLARMYS